MVRMPDTLMKLSSLSLVKGIEIERGNWLTATEETSMPATQHAAGREQRGLGVKSTGKSRATARDWKCRGCSAVQEAGGLPQGNRGRGVGSIGRSSRAKGLCQEIYPAEVLWKDCLKRHSKSQYFFLPLETITWSTDCSLSVVSEDLSATG